MKVERKCQTEPTPQTSQQAITLMHEGWCAARAGVPEDASMPEAWVCGHRLYLSPCVQTKLLRIGLLQ